MFNNLVECAKTKKDSKTWAYFAVTSTVWTLALAGSIVGGIFLYDAKLDEQLSLLTMLVAPPPPPPPPPAGHMTAKPNVTPTRPDYPVIKPPDHIETNVESKPHTASAKLVRVDASAGFDVDGGIDGGVIGGQVGGQLGGVLGSPVTDVEPPPPPKPDPIVEKPVEQPKPSIVRRSEGVIRGNTLTQVKPDYPTLARTAHIDGDVQVEIVIGEDGNVASTKVLGGHPLLQQAALSAARQWKFKPTLLNGTPVKVQGVLTFRFTL